jgi:hypothetical protein
MAYTSFRFNTADSATAGAVLSDAQGVVIGPRRSSAPLYPYVLGGITMGIVVGTAISPNFANTTWDAATDDIRLQQGWRVANSGTPVSLRWDVEPGTYRVILGLTGISTQRCRWRIQDGVGGPERYLQEFNASTLWGTDSGTAIDRWCDHTLANYPLGPNALTTAAAPLEIEIASGSFVFTNGGHSGATLNSDISFIAWERIEAPAPAGNFAQYYTTQLRAAGLI